jgi:hypothetical protein
VPPPSNSIATGDKSSLAQDRPFLVTEGVSRHIAIDLALAHRDRRTIAAAKPLGGSGDRVEHRLQIEAGPADDLEHVAGRGLVFERFFEVARAGLQFAEQPRVLDRDDRLVGKGADQLDLPVGKRLHPCPRETDRAGHDPIPQQRHTEHGSDFPSVTASASVYSGSEATSWTWTT